MKKAYFFVLVFLCVCFMSNAAEKLALKIELGEITEAIPVIDGSYYGGNILIDSRNITTTTVHDQCFTTSGIARDLYGFLFSGNPKHSVGDYSYIRIRNTGSEPITKIQFIGVSSHNSKDADLMLDGSSLSSAENDVDYDSFSTGALEVVPFNYLTGTNSICPSVRTPDLVDTWENWLGLTGEIKTLRLRFSDGTGDITSTMYDRKPILQAIYVYVDGTPTGIDAAETSSLRVHVADQEIRLSESADVLLYNVSGVTVKAAKNAQVVSVNDLPHGIYVLEAKIEDGSKTVTKIAIP
jgi:hypothetical protein